MFRGQRVNMLTKMLFLEVAKISGTDTGSFLGSWLF